MSVLPTAIYKSHKFVESSGNAMTQILIIEDDTDIAENLQYNFQREGFAAIIAESGEKGLRLALNEQNPPSLILLDLMLPGMSGMEICRRLRREPSTFKTPIIMLTAKSSESDRIAGLEIGADDYIIKPFSVKEVVARVHAVLRRMTERLFEIYKDDHISVDVGKIQVKCGDRDVKLTRKEFALLVHMIRRAGRVAPRQDLLDDVWGYNYSTDSRTLDVHIRRLRQKLGECGNYIETVAGIGYRFIK
jgi:two-component system, OmpR family, alkaline phosphatase synthesis response regulator PhoP